MAELADAADSKSADLRVLGVRLPLPAPLKFFRFKDAATERRAFFRAQSQRFDALTISSKFRGA